MDRWNRLLGDMMATSEMRTASTSASNVHWNKARQGVLLSSVHERLGSRTSISEHGDSQTDDASDGSQLEPPEKQAYQERKALARFVAEDLLCSEEEAQDAIMDIVDNRQYSVVMSGFRSQYFWWETVDMLRKLSILSVAAKFGHGTLQQVRTLWCSVRRRYCSLL